MTNELTNERLREIANRSLIEDESIIAAELLAKRQEVERFNEDLAGVEAALKDAGIGPIGNLGKRVGDLAYIEQRHRQERDAAQADVRDLTDILRRNGFRRCDSPACNCNSWHHVDGLAARFREIDEAVGDHNGKTLLQAVQEIVAQVRCRGCGGTVGDHLAPDQGGCPASFVIDGVSMVPQAHVARLASILAAVERQRDDLKQWIAAYRDKLGNYPETAHGQRVACDDILERMEAEPAEGGA